MDEVENTTCQNNCEKDAVALQDNSHLKRYKILSSIFITLSIIAYVAVTTILIVWLTDTLAASTDDVSSGLGMAFFVIFGLIVVGGCGYVISTILALVGLIMTAKRLKKGASLAMLIVFIALTVLPFITWGVFFAFA